ncbi:MAG: HAD family hydrolase [Clostridia bacterium]
MYKACIFDLDGTLANTLDSIAYFGNAALNFYGYNSIDANEYKNFIGNGADVLIERMLRFNGINFTKEEQTKIRNKYDRLYEENPLYLVNPYDGITCLLENLNENKVKVAVLSNKPHDMTTVVAKTLFHDVSFFEVLGQSEKFEKKPSPEAVNYLVSKMNYNKNEVLYIGDSGVDMQTATNAKLNSVGVLWGFRGKQELEENGATFTVNSALELANIILNRR